MKKPLNLTLPQARRIWLHAQRLDSRAPSAIVIPPGVGHAFYFPEPSIHIYSVTEYWDLADELGCRWDASGLDIDWGFDDPILSPRDEQLPDLETLVFTLNEKLSHNLDDKQQ